MNQSHYLKASVIILNWNGGIESCLEAVGSAIAQDYRYKEVIFVDNGSNDGALFHIQQAFSQVCCVQLSKNIGCPGGRNAGAEIASGDVLVFLENDGCWDDQTALSKIMSVMLEERIGALYTKVAGYATDEPDPPLDSAAQAVSGISLSHSFRGGASAVRSELFRRLGGFPADFFRQVEELYLAYLIYESGYVICYLPHVKMRHKGSDYQGKSSAVAHLNYKNTNHLIARLFPRSLALPLLFLRLSFYFVRMLKLVGFRQFLRESIVVLREAFGPGRPIRVKPATVELMDQLRSGAKADIAYRSDLCSPDNQLSDAILFRVVGRAVVRAIGGRR